jgi:hypothetical protein
MAYERDNSKDAVLAALRKACKWKHPDRLRDVPGEHACSYELSQENGDRVTVRIDQVTRPRSSGDVCLTVRPELLDRRDYQVLWVGRRRWLFVVPTRELKEYYDKRHFVFLRRNRWHFHVNRDADGWYELKPGNGESTFCLNGCKVEVDD